MRMQKGRFAPATGDGVGLASAPTRLAVGVVHLDHFDVRGCEMASQASPVGAGALHADAAHRAPRLQPAGRALLDLA